MAYVHRHFFQIVRTAAAVIFIISFGDGAWSQPTRLKLVVPFGAGTSIDILTRLLAEQIGRTKGPTAVIESRPGAGGIIATEAVAGAFSCRMAVAAPSRTFAFASPSNRAKAPCASQRSSEPWECLPTWSRWPWLKGRTGGLW